jgi:hypothetical protein
MKTTFCLAASLLIISSAFQFGKAQDKPADKAAPRTLKVNVKYTGAGTVDDKHKIQIFLFDSPDFTGGNAMPTGMQMTATKNGTVTFTDISGSPVYAAAIYDPTGGYDGASGPPPSGSSAGIYTKEPPKPAPIAIDAGKTVEIDLPFDDTIKMP